LSRRDTRAIVYLGQRVQAGSDMTVLGRLPPDAAKPQISIKLPLTNYGSRPKADI